MKEVPSSAFSGCSKLRTLTFGSSVASIGNSAFNNCERLASVSFPASLRSIGQYSFYNCSALRTVAFSEGLQSIGYRAFDNCTSLGNFTLPSTLGTIDSCAFEDCTAITSVTMPDGVTDIGASAFSGCIGLQTATIGNALYEIPSSCFGGCSALEDVRIGESVDTIHSSAFSGCEKLASVSFPASLRSIGQYSFYNCSALRTVAFSEGLESIGYCAFEGCTSLGNFTLPSTLGSIDSNAFKGCTAIKSIAIPDGVTDIGASAFSGCTGLKTATLGNALYEIPSSCFGGCSALEDVRIGESVDTIHSSAFSGCEKLAAFVALGNGIAEDSSHVGSYAFYGVPSTMIVYVDEDALGWGETWQGFKVVRGSQPPTGETETLVQVTLDRQRGSGGSSSVTATYGHSMPSITLPTRSGYTFGGYYTSTGGSGTQYYTASGASARIWDKTEATTLYAKWTAKTYTVMLDRQNGSGGSSSVTATYGMPMPAIALPTLSGYTFSGYYSSTNGTGTQYYTETGESARNWDLTYATTLYAKWIFTGNHALAAALDSDDSDLLFGTDDTTGWFVTQTSTFDGGYGDVARSGRIGNGGMSVMAATGTGSGIISFRWKVSSEKNCDYAYFYIDGVCKMRKTGTDSGWRHESWKVESGKHFFFWVYEKNNSYSSGSDCVWVDNVKWVTDSPLTPIYRFYSKRYGGHFFTRKEEEMYNVFNTDPNWNFEGTAYFALPEYESDAGVTRTYRFYSKSYRGHFYTIRYEEYLSTLGNRNWKYEEDRYYVRSSPGRGSSAVYRFWNKKKKHHFYTIDYDEFQRVCSTDPNWTYQPGNEFYAWAEPDDYVVNPKSFAKLAGTDFSDAADTGNDEDAVPAATESLCDGEIVLQEKWTLSATVGGSDSVFVVAAGDETEIGGGIRVETRFDPPDAAELQLGVDSGEAGEALPVGLSLRLPGVSVTEKAVLWSASDGVVAEGSFDGTFDFELPVSGVWHWLRTSDDAGKEVASIWLRAVAD